MAEAMLTRERPGTLSGQVYSNWQLARGATAFVDSLTPTHHIVFVSQLTDLADQLLWEAKRLIPLFPGWEVAHTYCVDGWGLSFKGQPLASVMARISEVIDGREFHRS
jgi:hypothetical protein